MSDNWDFYIAKVNDKLASIFVDIGVCEIAPDADHPWLLWVWVCLNHPREDGLCNSEEADTLLQIEDSLTEAVGHAVQGSLVGRITTEGRREFYFYAPSFAGFDDAVVRAMQPFPEHRWDADNKHDPEWSQYLGLLYPTPRDWQRIKNRHVIEQLLKHGDPLKKKRPVFHWAYFAEDSSRDQFVAAVQDRGFAVTHQDTVDDPSCTQPLSVKFEREDNVDWDSMNLVTLDLFELANSLRGDYDGWETSVERET